MIDGDMRHAGHAVASRTDQPSVAAARGLIGYLPGSVRAVSIEAGGVTALLGQVLWSAIGHPRGYWGAVIDDMAHIFRKSWVPLTVGIFGFLMMVAILAAQFLDLVGASYVFGPVILFQCARTYTVWVLAVVMVGIVGAALTSDIGARKVREELDAMEVMGIDPVRELAVPRVVSITLITMLLTVPAQLATIFSEQIGGAFVAHIREQDLYSNLFSNFSSTDFIAPIIDAALVGLIIGAVCCYKGFTAGGGALGLGKAVNQAVVFSLVAVFTLQLFYMSIYLSFYPELGEYR